MFNSFTEAVAAAVQCRHARRPVAPTPPPVSVQLADVLAGVHPVAVWLGWNVHLVQRRRDFIAALPWPYVATAYPEPNAKLGPVFNAYQLQAKLEAVSIFLRQLNPPPSERTWAPTAPHKTREPTASGVSWIRRLLGDKPYSLIAYYPGPSMERASALLPEATIMVADDPWPWSEIKVSRNAGGRWTYRYAWSDGGSP
jgi:hypothetical protein